MLQIPLLHALFKITLNLFTFRQLFVYNFAFQVIDVDIDLVAHHKGFFAFKLCPQNNPTETVLASCFDKYPLKLENGERFYHLAKNNIHGPGRVKAKVQLPTGLTCWHCILQTTYVSGNFLTNSILIWTTL